LKQNAEKSKKVAKSRLFLVVSGMFSVVSGVFWAVLGQFFALFLRFHNVQNGFLAQKRVFGI